MRKLVSLSLCIVACLSLVPVGLVLGAGTSTTFTAINLTPIATTVIPINLTFTTAQLTVVNSSTITSTLSFPITGSTILVPTSITSTSQITQVSTQTIISSTTLTGGGTATGFAIAFSPTYWQCNQQILVTLTGPFSVYVNAGDQIEFSYYQYSTGNTQQLMFKDTQTWLSGNTIQYYIQPSEWNYISFSYLPYIYVIVNDITVPSNAKPIQLYSAAQSGANPSNCGGSASPQVSVTYTTYTQLYSTTVNQYVTVGGTITVVPATTLASRTVTPIISVTRYITNATENRTLTNMAATTTTNSTVFETATYESTVTAPVGNVTMETFGYYAAIFAGLVGIGFLFKYKDIIARKRGKKTNPTPTESDAEVEPKTRKRRPGKHAVALEPIAPKDQQTLIEITDLDKMNAESPG